MKAIMSDAIQQVRIDYLQKQLYMFEEEQRVIEKSLRQKRQQLEDVKLAISLLKYGVKVGSIVCVNKTEVRVTKIEIWGGDSKPWVSGNMRKKDGTWGSRVIRLYTNWEVKET